METNADRREHPASEKLCRFLSGAATREERRGVMAHLLRGCNACASIFRELLKPELPPQGAYDEALSRFTNRLVHVLEQRMADANLKPEKETMTETADEMLQLTEKESIRSELEAIANEAETLGARLRALHTSLPISSREDLMLLGEEDPDFPCIVRGAIECALTDHLGIVCETLRTAARAEGQ